MADGFHPLFFLSRGDGNPPSTVTTSPPAPLAFFNDAKRQFVQREQCKTAILYVDVQRRYCDTSYDIHEDLDGRAPQQEVAKRIATFDQQPGTEKFLKIMIVMESTTEGMHPFAISERRMTKRFSKSSPNAFSNSSLDAYLKSKGVENLLIVGVARNGCVLATALGGIAHGYKVEVSLPLTANGQDFEQIIQRHGEANYAGLSTARASDVRQIIWRCSSDSLLQPSVAIDSALRDQITHTCLIGDNVFTAYTYNSKDEAKAAVSRAYEAYQAQIQEFPGAGIGRPVLSSHGDAHVAVVRTSDSFPLRELMSQQMGIPHSYVLAPKGTR